MLSLVQMNNGSGLQALHVCYTSVTENSYSLKFI